MKGLLITLGVVAVAAGVVYLMKDNETVKGALDKINDATSDALGKINSNWKKASDQFSKTASQAQSAV